MIKLYGFGPNLGLVDPSPFVLKVLTFLHVAGLDYEVINDFSNMQKAPKGKLPFIVDDGELIADSFFILKHLQAKYDIDLDSDLNEQQKALSGLITQSLEDNFYWCIIYSRWIDDRYWPTVKKAFFGSMPFPVNAILPLIARRNVRKSLYLQGLGRHNRDEIMLIAKETLHNLSVLLADKTCFFGEQPSQLDIVAYAFLSQVTLVSFKSELQQLAHQYENLVTYCERMNQAYFS